MAITKVLPDGTRFEVLIHRVTTWSTSSEWAQIHEASRTYLINGRAVPREEFQVAIGEFHWRGIDSVPACCLGQSL